MEYTVGQLLADLEPKLHDQTLDKLSGNIFDKVHQAARKVLGRIDPDETIAYLPLGLLNTDQDFRYSIPMNLKGKKVISILPTDDLEGYLQYGNRSYRDFTFRREYGDINIRYENGVKYIYFVGYNGTEDAPGVYSILYYTNTLFTSADGLTLKKKPDDEDDIILAEDDLYEVLLNELAYICAHELQSEESAFDLSAYQKEITQAYNNYGAEHKSQAEKPRNTYYRYNGRGRNWGTGYYYKN